MKTHSIEICETLTKIVLVSATSKLEAEQIVRERYYKGDYVLTADDFQEVSFENLEE